MFVSKLPQTGFDMLAAAAPPRRIADIRSPLMETYCSGEQRKPFHLRADISAHRRASAAVLRH